MKKQINVTKTYLPPLGDYLNQLDDIWDEGWITNNGKKVIKLEDKLKEFLEVKDLYLVANGTLALQFAVKTLDSPGEIITTPFSYIASTSSILWENYKPVFADIDPKTLCINPENIEKMITKNTRAILGVHVFGNPCDVEAIQKIAKKNNLKIIYDAAHAFGVKYKNKSILSYGDISVLSFHATKVFHTIEGGALISKDKEINKKISYMRHFGHNGPYDFHDLGINGKLSEFHAAMGLVVLKHVKDNIEKRRKITLKYDSLLDGVIDRIKISPDIEYNYAYYPVIFSSERKLKSVVKSLNKFNIFPRRYFYPSLSTVPYVVKKLGKSFCPNAEDISKRVLCLPLYPELKEEEVIKISKIIIKN